MKKLFHLIKSVRLAVALIFLLAVISLAGVFLPQIPVNIASSPTGYAWWVENIAYGELGDIAYTLQPLGIFHIYRSVWFIAVAALLMLNIAACTLARIRPLRHRTQKAVVRWDDTFYEHGKVAASHEIAFDLAAAADTAEKALLARRYTVRREGEPDAVCLAATKRRLSPWGTLSVHLSLILLLAGVLIGAQFGFRNEAFTIVEGTEEDIGYGTGLSVLLRSFADTYWEDGTPRDYQSKVTVYKNGDEVKTGVIRVNHPLSVGGVRFHQGYFGQAAGLEITDEEGSVLYSSAVALTDIQGSGSLARPKGLVVLPDSRYSVILLGSAGSADRSIAAGQLGVELYNAELNFVGWLLLAQGVPQQLGGMTFAYHGLQYSGLMVSSDPGAPFLWAAALLFLLGLTVRFYFPQRQLWLKLTRISDTIVLLKLRSRARHGEDHGSEAERILTSLGMAANPGGSKRES